jgi:hypothetical protein
MSLIFNEDPNHFVIGRWRAGCRTVTRPQAEAFIDQYRGTGITDFMICLGASSNWYPSPNTENVLDKHLRWKAEGRLSDPDELQEAVKNCPALLVDYRAQYGEDLQQTWIRRLRQIGIRPWISFRMNDIHDGARKDAFLHSEFYNKHIDSCGRTPHRAPSGYYDYALDFRCPEVRQHYLDIIRDGLFHFDADGVEFDWMREPFSAAIGREAEALPLISEFMEAAFDLTAQAAEKWGHPIQIAVRVPDGPEKCLRLGLDIFRWLNSGRVNLLIVAPRWGTSDHDLPLDVWQGIIGTRPIRLAAGMEILLDGGRRPRRTYASHTEETARGLAYSILCRGAEVYLFNYMDYTAPGESFLSRPAEYHRFLTDANDRTALMHRRRRQVVSYCDVAATGAAPRKPLPMRIRAGEYNTLRIPVGTLLPGQAAQLMLGLEPGFDGALQVWVNGCPCPMMPAASPAAPAPEDLHYIAFDLPEKCRTHDILVAEITAAEGRGEIAWAEICNEAME